MKILCDDCGKEEASVLCCADEAMLCNDCDRRIHRANKLASKHHRFELISSSNSSTHSHPLCDICQKNFAFLFCQEDRAILCIDCNTSIHGANHFTMKHNRFVLSGVRLSSISISNPETIDDDEVVPPKITTNTVTSKTNQNTIISSIKSASMNVPSVNIPSPINTFESGSHFSEYPNEMWHVDELLVNHNLTTNFDNFPEVDKSVSFWDSDLEPNDQLPLWVPQNSQFGLDGGGIADLFPPSNGREDGGMKVGIEERSEDVFMVPHVTYINHSNSSKKAKHSTWY